MHAAAQQGANLLRESEPLLASLEDRHLALEPVPGTKTAGWLLGHLVITGDFGRRLCGLAPLSPKEWRAGYAPGTTPSWDASTYPPMRDLVAAFRAVYSDLVANAPRTPAEVLAAPNPFPPTRDAFPTAGEFVQYLVAGHLAYHLGQLSIWRATAAGADPNLRASSSSWSPRPEVVHEAPPLPTAPAAPPGAEGWAAEGSVPPPINPKDET